MAHYRKIDTRIWNDQKFCALSDDGKLCFLFVLTHPHLTALGAMRATRAGLAEELDWSAARFARAWEGVCPSLIRYDAKAACLWVPNFLRYNQPESPNVVRAWAKALDTLPECHLRDEAIRTAAAVCEEKAHTTPKGKAFLKAFLEAFHEGSPEGCRHPSPNQEQEQEQEQEHKQITDDDYERKVVAHVAPLRPVVAVSSSSSSVSPSSEPLKRYAVAAQEAHALWAAAMPSAEPREWADIRPPGRRKIAEFVRDCGSLDAVQRFVDRVAANDYLAGRMDRPPLNFFKAIDLYDRIMAGSYDHWPKAKAPESRHPALVDISAQIAAEAEERRLAAEERAARKAREERLA